MNLAHVLLLDPTDPISQMVGNGITDLIARLTGERAKAWEVRLSKDRFLAEYDRMVLKLESRVQEIPSFTVWVLCDRDSLNAEIKENFHFKALLGMLILTFPDVSWRFIPVGSDKSLFREFAQALRDSNLRKEPLFDADGLQGHLRRIFGANSSIREMRAVAVDEEDDYAYFNAYTAWRFGFCAEVINTRALLDDRFGRAGSNRPIELAIEDRCLGFPDKEEDLSDPEKREKAYPGLTKVAWRVEVTSGEENGHAQAGRADSYCGRRVGKPMPGIFALWRASGMWKEMKAKQRAEKNKPVGGEFIPGFVPSFQRNLESRMDDHSAPGRLMVIATRLIARCESRLDSALSSRVAVRGAVLATQAYELLERKTPTLAFEALTLKHCFESKAECQFYGIEGMMDLKDRFKEIKAESWSISLCFGAEKRLQSELNARHKIMAKLALIYRDMNYFDEDQMCSVEGRAISQKLSFSRRRLLFPFVRQGLFIKWLQENIRSSKILRLLERGKAQKAIYYFITSPINIVAAVVQIVAKLPLIYFNKIISSFKMFCLWVFIWPMVFASGYYLFYNHNIPKYNNIPFTQKLSGCFTESRSSLFPTNDLEAKERKNRVWKSIAMSASTFFALQPSGELAKENFDITSTSPISFLWLLETMLGLLHVGIFISLIYDTLSRNK